MMAFAIFIFRYVCLISLNKTNADIPPVYNETSHCVPGILP